MFVHALSVMGREYFLAKLFVLEKKLFLCALAGKILLRYLL